MMKKFASLLVLLIAAAAVYLAVTPSPIDPVAWNPPPAPSMTGVLEPNDTLMKAELLGLGWDDYLDAGGVVIVEWADRFPEMLPTHARWYTLALQGEGREVTEAGKA